jgi:hypothetical protein
MKVSSSAVVRGNVGQYVSNNVALSKFLTIQAAQIQSLNEVQLLFCMYMLKYLYKISKLTNLPSQTHILYTYLNICVSSFFIFNRELYETFKKKSVVDSCKPDP